MIAAGLTAESNKSSRGWEAALEWLRALPFEHVLEKNDLDKWLERNQNELSQELKVTPRTEIFGRLQAELKSLKMERQVLVFPSILLFSSSSGPAPPLHYWAAPPVPWANLTFSDETLFRKCAHYFLNRVHGNS